MLNALKIRPKIIFPKEYAKISKGSVSKISKSSNFLWIFIKYSIGIYLPFCYKLILRSALFFNIDSKSIE